MSEVELKAIIERASVAAAKDTEKRMKGMESDLDRLANEAKELNAPRLEISGQRLGDSLHSDRNIVRLELRKYERGRSE